MAMPGTLMTLKGKEKGKAWGIGVDIRKVQPKTDLGILMKRTQIDFASDDEVKWIRGSRNAMSMIISMSP